MNESRRQFAGTIPNAYDHHLGPVLFAGFAADLARRTAATFPAHVLEIACGTGVVTRCLRDALPPDTLLTATDLSASMLAVAAAKFSGDPQVFIEVADACSLPYDDRSFDAVACQFGVMFFQERDRAYQEAYRVLTPEGRLVFSVWDTMKQNHFVSVVDAAISTFFCGSPLGFLQTAFGYNDTDAIRSSLVRAGFADVEVAVMTLQKDVEDVGNFAHGLIHGGPMIEAVRQLGGISSEAVVAKVAAALTREFGNPPRIILQALVFDARRTQTDTFPTLMVSRA